jgi:hypothetical protein
VIKPIIIYASETWVLKEKEIRMLNVWGRKILRKIFGAKKEENEWRIRNNQELRNMYGQPEIIGDIKSKRLGWLGHVVRLEEDRMVKRIFEGHPGGRRKTGRPRKRWLDDVEEDLILMKVKRGRIRATERTVWAKIIREAKALHGL